MGDFYAGFHILPASAMRAKEKMANTSETNKSVVAAAVQSAETARSNDIHQNHNQNFGPVFPSKIAT